MSEAEKIIDRMHVKLAKFRENRWDMPKYWALDIGARQAVKMILAHPRKPPLGEVKTFLGIEIIPLEDVIIVDSQFKEDTE